MINHRANTAGSEAAARTLGFNSVPPARWSSSFKGPVQTSSTRTAAMTKLAFKGNDVLPGGKADKLPESSFDRRALAQGTKVEREHVKSKRMAKEIASDHITEFPNYYPELKKLEKKLEKKANVLRRMLTTGIPKDVKVTGASNARLISQARPGDIALTMWRSPFDMERALNKGRLYAAQQRAIYGVGEGPGHASLVTGGGDAVGLFPGGPGLVMEHLDSQAPTVIVRPKARASQGEAAASAALRQAQAAGQSGRVPKAEGASPKKDMIDRLGYFYDPELLRIMESRSFDQPLAVNRLGDIPVIGGPVGSLARRIRNRSLQPCDPHSEVCSTAVVRHWSDPNALGERAYPFFSGAPETPQQLQKYYISPGRLGLSRNVDLVGTNFDF
jgi:hypothetical protein